MRRFRVVRDAMRRLCFVICLASMITCGAVSRAHAAPIKLSIIGYAFNVPVNETIDVSNGFSGATIPLTDFPIGAVYGSIPEGASKSIDSSISLEATLFDSTHNLASLTLSGPIHVSLIHWLGNPNVEGGVQGSTTSSGLRVFPGVDPGAIPAWFSGLGAGVSGNVTGGGYNLLQSNLNIGPGAGPPSETPPVPEPTSFAVFLVLAGVGLGVRRYGRA